jgi:type II secretory pathway pseudopilin PulG
MKKIIFPLIIGLIIGAIIMFYVLDQDTSPSVTSDTQNSFYEVTSNLDKGGNLYLYASTEKIMKTVEEFALTLRNLLEKNISKISKSQPGEPEPLQVFDFVYNLFKNSGLNEISGIGLSSVTMENNLNHTTLNIHHYKNKGKGLMWNMMESNPHPLKGLSYLPKETVIASFSDFRLQELWNWILKEAETSNLPKLKKGLESVKPMLQMQGIELEKLLGSMTGRIGWVLSMDESKMVPIPSPKGTIEIPTPALALVLGVQDTYIFDLLAKMIPMAKKSEEKDAKKLTIPIPPMPIPLEPTIIQEDGLLIIASNSQIIDNILESNKKGNGLTTTEDFKKISQNMPDKGNSFRYISSKLFKMIMDIQKKTMEKEGKVSEENKAAMDFLELFPKEWSMYGVIQNTDEGFLMKYNHTLNLEYAILLPATATLGVVAAIAIPNFITATQKGKQKATMGTLKSISTAIEAYWVDNGVQPEGNSMAELKSKLEPLYIKVLPMKDAWGNDLLYTRGTGDQKDSYFIGSPGKDGIFQGWQQIGFYIAAGVNDFNNDIIISDATFVYGPKVH